MPSNRKGGNYFTDVTLSFSIDRLRESASRLNQLTDEAAETIRRIEAFLSDECSIGLEAHVKFRESGNPLDPVTSYLEYRRLGGKFRIVVSIWDEAAQVERSHKVWAECSRDEKIASIKALPKLLDKLNEEVNQKIQEAESISNLLNAIGQKAEAGEEK